MSFPVSLAHVCTFTSCGTNSPQLHISFYVFTVTIAGISDQAIIVGRTEDGTGKGTVALLTRVVNYAVVHQNVGNWHAEQMDTVRN